MPLANNGPQTLLKTKFESEKYIAIIIVDFNVSLGLEYSLKIPTLSVQDKSVKRGRGIQNCRMRGRLSRDEISDRNWHSIFDILSAFRRPKKSMKNIRKI
jgi:hypothetical protein